jgi:DNA-binding transcriptional LysR family regulator
MPADGSAGFDTARLRVFREVVRRGSLSAAAEALSFSRPAVSR